MSTDTAVTTPSQPELVILDGAAYRAEHVYGGQAVLASMVIAAWDVATAQLFG